MTIKVGYRPRHAPADEIASTSHTGHMQCAGVGEVQLKPHGVAVVPLMLVEGYRGEEPGILHVTLTDDQRQRLIAQLSKE